MKDVNALKKIEMEGRQPGFPDRAPSPSQKDRELIINQIDIGQRISKHLIMTFEILGHPYIKKNTARHFQGRCIYTQNFLRWEKFAILQLLKQNRDQITFKGPVHIDYIFHFKNHKAESDLTNNLEGISDVLQKVRIIENDKNIVSLTAKKLFGLDPKVIVTLTQVSI